MSRVAVGVVLALLGGALLGNGLLQGAYSIAQWLKQGGYGGPAPSTAGLVAGLGLGLLLVGLRFLREGLAQQPERR